MSDEPFGLPGPMTDFAIEGDLDEGFVTIHLSTALQAVAAQVSAETAGQVLSAIIRAGGQSSPDHRTSESHVAPVVVSPVEVPRLAVAAPKDGDSRRLTLIFAVGRLNLSFSVSIRQLVQAVNQYGASGVEGPPPPKPN